MDRRVRLHRDRTNVGIVLFQSARDPDKRSARSQPAEKVGHAPQGLLPNFATCAVIVRSPISFVVVLIGIKILMWLASRDFTRQQLRPVTALQRISFNY